MILSHINTPPLVRDVEIIDGIRIIALLDIGAMKLNAIYTNGTRLKDFVDVYALLRYFSPQQLIQAFEQKYPDVDSAMVKKALVYHVDIQLKELVEYIGPEIKWTTIAEKLNKAFHNPYITLDIPDENTKRLMEHLQSQEKGKNKGHKL